MWLFQMSGQMVELVVRDLAEKVIQLAQEENHFSYVYDEEDSIETKLTKIVTKVYGGKGISLTPAAKRELKELEALGFSNYPICMAKTQYSFSDDAKKMGAPKDFTVNNQQSQGGCRSWLHRGSHWYHHDHAWPT